MLKLILQSFWYRLNIKMDYWQVMPANITKLPRFFVSTEQFVCTCIALILLLLISLALLIKQFYRTFHGYTNIDYITGYAVKYEAIKTLNYIPENEDDRIFVQSCRKFSRYESRFLQLWCLLPIVAINIGTNTCNTMHIVGFGVATILYFLFNILRISQNRILRILWVFPLILAYLPFYIFSRNLFQK